MSWQPELDELKTREEFAEQLGGEDRVKRQHDGGRYTIRERIGKLVDSDSFHEVGKIAGMASYDGQNNLEHLLPSNFVFWAGSARWPAGDCGRGRFYRARWLCRCDD